jgi:hypothetical protein
MGTFNLMGPVERDNHNYWTVHWWKLPFSKGPKSRDPSLEDGNRSSFRTEVFYSYLELRMMDKVHETETLKALVNSGVITTVAFSVSHCTGWNSYFIQPYHIFWNQNIK